MFSHRSYYTCTDTHLHPNKLPSPCVPSALDACAAPGLAPLFPAPWTRVHVQARVVSCDCACAKKENKQVLGIYYVYAFSKHCKDEEAWRSGKRECSRRSQHGKTSQTLGLPTIFECILAAILGLDSHLEPVSRDVI